MSRIVTVALAVLVTLLCAALAEAKPLRVVASVPDVADLARRVGGDEVTVESLVRGPQDAHFVDPRPTFVRLLHDADLYVEQGLQLEIGWSPVLLQSARNPRVRPPAGEGYVDASRAIVPLEVPAGVVDRSQGDVHPGGNPHYLSDPLNGLRVAKLLAERLSAARPGAAEKFAANAAAFERELLERLVGPELAARTPPAELVAAIEANRLDGTAGGWLGRMARARGVPAVQDHRLWPYFARRFGLELVAELEPIPGIAPTTAHLTEVVGLVKARGVRLLLASPYFDPRHARAVSERTGIPVVTLAHQTGALPGADDYLSTVERNVRAVAEALDGR
jgi:zinc/manganese transport system substrate-binding protein